MITSHQRELRKKSIGSSDAAAIVGVNPWRSSGDIYLDKTADLPESPTSEAAVIGTYLENSVLEWFSNDSGKKILKNQRRVHGNGYMAANLDALVVGENEIVEAKTAGIMTPFDRDSWGEIGTSEVPDHISIQAMHQMAVMGEEYRLVWIPVLLGGVGFRTYKIERNDALIADLFKIEGRFWNEHVLKGIPPQDSLPSLETLKKIRRQPSKTVPLGDDILREWLRAKDMEKIAKTAKDEAEAKLLNALGDAEAGTSELGDITYFEQTRKAYEVKENTFRVLRHKKPKEVA